MDGNNVAVDIVLAYPARGWFDALAQQVRDVLAADAAIGNVTVSVSSRIGAHKVQKDLNPLPTVRKHHRRGVGQGWRRQVDHRSKSGSGPGCRRRQSGRARCRYLRPQHSAHAWRIRQARFVRRPAHRTQARAWAAGNVDRLPDRGRHADDLARADGDAGAYSTAQRNQLGRSRLPDHRPAAGHRRYPAHPVPARARFRRRDRDHAAGHRPARRPQGAEDVREGRGAGAGHCGKHGNSYLFAMWTRRAHLRCRRRRTHGGRIRRAAARLAAAGYPHP